MPVATFFTNTTPMKRLVLAAIALTFVLSATADRAEAQLAIMPHVGYSLAAEGVVIGVEGRFGLPLGGPLSIAIQPGVQTTLGSDPYIQIDGNLVGLFNIPLSPIQPYAGAGVALGIFDTPTETGSTMGFNILGGASFGGGMIRPYVQGRQTLGGALNGFTVQGGIIVGL
ncbi:hypothetical protein BH23BAC4_BH23BAC4_04880 [soil metagenome]